MRTEQAIRESLAEMERMAEDAERMTKHEGVKAVPFLLKQFQIWRERSSARANILKWVLELPYLEEQPPSLTNKTS